MRSWMQRPASPQATAANQPPAVSPRPAGDLTGRPRELSTANADVKLVTVYLPRGRSLGTDTCVEVLR